MTGERSVPINKRLSTVILEPENDGGYSCLVRLYRVSRMIMVKAGLAAVLSIPDHRELKRGTLRGLIRKAGLGVEEFVELLQR